ncbi:leukocyte immunoglobulin-like receptor subfamily A member 5 isoform X2 [Phascolarctos cinereus]|uniref:Leukocyte immunoglobulin-like receptor subfamily A member 2 isoform X2 n=1 Tax=Phascolarctos cinereus TaxID=38626 RepID=A0A6P5LNE0_PHACI|nr:leukocyte immunoglobulin-like receptor subfamily A member 2 isoform X2 [Phascolarctos cinereus]
MGPAGTALLCLETFLRPTLEADSSPVIPQGTPVTLRCKGHPGAIWYFLMKGEIQFQGVLGEKMEANFHIHSMTRDTAGSYHCFYMTLSGFSELSEPLELVMTGFYDKPSLLVVSIQEVAEGQIVTLSCHSEQPFDQFTFYKERGANTSQLQTVWFWTNISIVSMTTTQEGTYRCYSFHSQYPYLWSASSDLLEVKVADAAPQDYTVGNLIRFSLAGLVLIILAILSVEAWYSWRVLQEAALA